MAQVDLAVRAHCIWPLLELVTQQTLLPELTRAHKQGFFVSLMAMKWS